MALGPALRLRRRPGLGGGPHRLMSRHAYATLARARRPHGPIASYADDERALLLSCAMHRRRWPTSTTIRAVGAGALRWRADTAVELVPRLRRAQQRGLRPCPHGHHRPCSTATPPASSPTSASCKMKKLVGGGTMTIVNQTVPRALRRLDYSRARSTPSSPTSTSTRPSSALPTWPPSTWPSSPARWATTPSTTRATSR